jgi:DNA-binding GntR family transcriptional regulator
MKLIPVEQRTLGDEAADRLRTAIRSGNLRPGERLVERDLAERLGMSRIPIREAIHRLAEEGLVRKLTHRGTFVYAPTLAEIEEISSLRVVLERFVVERVITNWTLVHEARLQQVVEYMRNAAINQDVHGVSDQDYLFHRVLWEIADHRLLLEVVSTLGARINRFLHEANGILTAEQLDAHVIAHEQLIKVLQRGDVLQAQDEMTQHVLSAKSRILNYCNFPDGVAISEA